MQTEEMRLDGNAAGGTLADVFVPEMTAARVTCSGCGVTRAMGTLLEYGQTMGVILRCPGCDTAMLRMVRARGFLRIDVSGISLIAVEEPPAA
jgi:hypothetical protein